MDTYSMRAEMKKLACLKKMRMISNSSSRINEIPVGKRNMMKMRKELLLNRCEGNQGLKGHKFQSPSKLRKMVQNHKGPEGEGLNRTTKFKLASITKAGIE
jgi:hypothetical protein